LNLNFYDENHTRAVNVLSSLTYLMWLPTGTGFAIYYLYTHPDEFRYFWDLVCRRNGASFFPPDVCKLYDRMAPAICVNIPCCMPKYLTTYAYDSDTTLNPQLVTSCRHRHRRKHARRIRMCCPVQKRILFLQIITLL